MEQESQEFYIAITIYGGLILGGLLVSVVLGAFGLLLWGKLKKGSTIKKLYEQERKNGQGGSHGKY